MPNGLGAILAALAGGAGGYVESKQNQRAEALVAEKLRREEDDRKERKAFQQFEMERELRKMGGRYTDEMGPGTLNPDAPSLVKMDRVETALPGTEAMVGDTVLPPLKVGLTPMKAALGIEPNKERVRMASQATEVPGSGGRRVYLPTANELSDQDFARRQREGKSEREVIASEQMVKRNEEEKRVIDRLRGASVSEETIAATLSGLKPTDVGITPQMREELRIQAMRIASESNSAMGHAIQAFMTKDPLNPPTAGELQFFIDAYKMSSGGPRPKDLNNPPSNPFYFRPPGSPK